MLANAAALAAALMGPVMSTQKSIEIPTPKIQYIGKLPSKRQRRRIKVKEELRFQRRMEQAIRKKRNLLSRRSKSEDEAEYQKTVSSMTNWQRNQWARAGYRPEEAAIFAQIKKMVAEPDAPALAA